MTAETDSSLSCVHSSMRLLNRCKLENELDVVEFWYMYLEWRG
jgi:hypothetical protein